MKMNNISRATDMNKISKSWKRIKNRESDEHEQYLKKSWNQNHPQLIAISGSDFPVTQCATDLKEQHDTDQDRSLIHYPREIVVLFALEQFVICKT